MFYSCKESGSGTKQIVAIINVNIIPMTEEIVYENHSIIISDNKIKAIGKHHEVDIPKGAVIIDANNHYLIPGLGDMHAHLPTDSSGNLLYNSFDLFLANGVTFIRNMWGTPSTLNLREKNNNGELEGPEIYTTGPLIDGFGTIFKRNVLLTDPVEVDNAITEMRDNGFDAIKVYDNLSSEVYAAIIESAEKNNLPVVGHVPFAAGLETVLKSGQLSIEHFRGYKDYYLNDNIIRMTVASGIWNCPTLFQKYTGNHLNEIASLKSEAAKYIPQYILDSWDSYTPRNSADIYSSETECEKLLLELHKNGGKIVAGTDCGQPYVIPGFSLHEELEWINKAGLTPYETLLTATLNAAQLLGWDDRLGTIEEGKDASLVLLEKNPLDDISNSKSIIGLFVKGKWYSKNDIDEKLKDSIVKNDFR